MGSILFFPFYVFFNTLFIYLFIYGCVGSLSFRVRAFSSCRKWGPLFIAVRGPFTIVAPPVAGHRLQTRRLSSCGSQAQLLHGMWDPPRPGLEPMSPALAGRFSTTAPPGKPHFMFLISQIILFLLLVCCQIEVAIVIFFFFSPFSPLCYSKLFNNLF